jgi:hypothetical protein
VQFTVYEFEKKNCSCLLSILLSMATERVRRPPNPSSRLTADSNAAQPALASHRVSIALAQAKRAAEAQITRDVTVDPQAPEQQNEDQLEALPPMTPTTIASRASTIPLTDLDSENSDHTSAAAKKKQKKRKRARKSGM